ncbi:MAG: four helix bundle protein [Bacteroidia bacterium]
MSENYKGGFEDLEVWKESRIFRKTISTLVKKFPDSEKYKFTDQLLRSSRSITANISEGYGRFHFQETIQFCRHSRGSLMDSLDHLICAVDENFIDDTELSSFRKQIALILKLLNGYILYLKNRKKDEDN